MKSPKIHFAINAKLHHGQSINGVYLPLFVKRITANEDSEFKVLNILSNHNLEISIEKLNRNK